MINGMPNPRATFANSVASQYKFFRVPSQQTIWNRHPVCVLVEKLFNRGRFVNTFARNDFGLFGERRLALEPALLAVILAGGAGTFIHYELPGSARMAGLSAWGAGPTIEQAELLPAVIFAPAVPLPISLGASPVQPQAGRLPAAPALGSQSLKVTTATRLDQRPVATGSFLSRLHGRAAQQDYVIRLAFPEPAAADLAIVAMPTRGENAALAREVLAMAGSAHDGIAAVDMDGPDPAAVASIQTARLAELQQASGAELQQFAGPASLPLDGLKFDLAALPNNARANTGAALHKSAPAGLKLAGTGDRIVGEFIFHQAAVQLNERQAGQVDVRIGGDASLAVQVSALLAIVEGQMDPASFAALSVSASAAEYVSFREIRDAGIGVRYDAAANRIVFTAD